MNHLRNALALMVLALFGFACGGPDEAEYSPSSDVVTKPAALKTGGENSPTRIRIIVGGLDDGEPSTLYSLDKVDDGCRVTNQNTGAQCTSSDANGCKIGITYGECCEGNNCVHV